MDSTRPRRVLASLLYALALLTLAWHLPAWAPNRVPFDHIKVIDGIAISGPAGCRLIETKLAEDGFAEKLQALFDHVAADDQLCREWGSNTKRIYTDWEGAFFSLKGPLRIFNTSSLYPLRFESQSTNELIIGSSQGFSGTCGLRLQGNVTLRNIQISNMPAARGVCIESSGPTIDTADVHGNQIGLYVAPTVTNAMIVHSKFHLNATATLIDGSGVLLQDNTFVQNQSPPIQLSPAIQAATPPPTLSAVLGYNAADQPAWLHVTLQGNQAILSGEVYVVDWEGLARFRPIAPGAPVYTTTGPDSILYSIPLTTLNDLDDNSVAEGHITLAGTLTYPNGAGQTSALTASAEFSLKPPPPGPAAPVVYGCDLSGLTPTQVIAKIKAASNSDTECLTQNGQKKLLYWSHSEAVVTIPLHAPLEINRFSTVPLHIQGIPAASLEEEQHPKIRFVAAPDFQGDAGLRIFDNVTIQSLHVSGFKQGVGTTAIVLQRSNSILSNLVVADNAIGVDVGLGLTDVKIFSAFFQQNKVGVISRGDGVEIQNNTYQGQTEALVKVGTASPYATPTVQGVEVAKFSRSAGETIRVTLGYGKSSVGIPVAKKLLLAVDPANPSTSDPRIELVLSDSPTNLLNSHVVPDKAPPLHCTDNPTTRTISCEFLWRDMTNGFPAAASFAVAVNYQDGQTSPFSAPVIPPKAQLTPAADGPATGGGAGDPIVPPPPDTETDDGDSGSGDNPLAGDDAAGDPLAGAGDGQPPAGADSAAADVPATNNPASPQPDGNANGSGTATPTPAAVLAPDETLVPATIATPEAFTLPLTTPTTPVGSTPTAPDTSGILAPSGTDAAPQAPTDPGSAFDTIGPGAPAATDTGGCSLRLRP